MKPEPYSQVKLLNPLLDTDTLQNVWRNLLATHAKLSYPETSTNILLNHPDYNNHTIYDTDILNSLTIGDISVLYEYSLAYVNPESRKKSGQYFTPDDVAKFMISQTKYFPEGRWLDPCSGVGNLSYWLTVAHYNPEQFIIHSLTLTDLDPTALFIARSIFFLHFYQNEPEFYNIMKNKWVCQNFLNNTPPEYDYAILNPPYASTAENKTFQTHKTRDLYAYFLEKVIKTSKGFISVTPQSYTNGEKFHILRKLLINKFNNLYIYNFDNIPDSIFKGIKFGSVNTNTANSTRASILVATSKETRNYKITPLLRWQTNQREQMFNLVETKLSSQVLGENIFPKNYKHFTELYKQAQTLPTLKMLLSPTPTEYSLTIPTTPRYYITATKRKLNRSSYTTLYFPDEYKQNQAYILLNSSIMFWWWRVNDGGMTISQKTLLSLPVFKTNKNATALIHKLEQSEQSNLVTKLNAGKNNENVKHSKSLIEELNNHIIGEYHSKLLIKLHNNTDF